jgi:broad specificity phosphatase PhoE
VAVDLAAPRVSATLRAERQEKFGIIIADTPFAKQDWNEPAWNQKKRNHNIATQGVRISTRFILIRHGETEWNRQDRFRGRSDVPLNENGLAQAEKIAARFANVKINAVYTSPLPRAIQTAVPLAAMHHLEIEQTADLLDIDYGAWEGMAREDILAKFPDLYAQWVKSPGKVKFPGGESVRQVRLRVEKLLSNLCEDHLGKTIALVSHRVTCHIILCVAFGLPNDALWHLRQDVGCINEFELRDGAYVVTLMNETDHLR